MRRIPPAALIGAALAALFIWRSAPQDAAPEDYSHEGNNAGPWPPADDTPAGSPLDPGASAGDPVAALLWAIRNAEHRRIDVTSGLDYATLYGGRRFEFYDDHPTITGEWMGAPLSAEMCRAAGQRVGCKTTAAGAYQIIRPTWDRVRAAGAWGPRLPDFYPPSQDEAARRLLIECGAMARLQAGDIEGAIGRASRLWASLPGSTVGQPKKSLGDMLAFFDEGLSNG